MKLGWKRLLKLADILDVADAQHRKLREKTYSQLSFTHPCGTPACALGHYATNNRRRGWSVEGGCVVYGGRMLTEYTKVEQEFEVSRNDCKELFSAEGCGNSKTAKQAAKYLRKFVKRKQAEAP